MSKKILVVDDTPDLLSAVLDILKMESFDVRGVKNGKEAMLRLEIFRPDLIITDLMMPDLNGYQLISEIRKSKEFDNTSILVFTTLSSPDEERKAVLLGADSYLKKPCSLDDLVEATRKLINTQGH